MTNSARRSAARRRSWLVGPFCTGVLVAVAALSGCASGDKSPQVASVGAGTPSAAANADRGSQITKYRACLLSNGVTLLDQPTAEGMPQIDKERTNVDVLAAAQEKCRPYLPTADSTGKPDQQAIEAARRLAECLRSHGVPEYPDPDPATGESPVSAELAARLKTEPALSSAMQTCQQQVLPRSTGGTIGG